MKSETFNNDIVFLKTIKDIREKEANGSVEPLGDIDEQTGVIRWSLDDVLANKIDRDNALAPFLRSKHVWHGHPDGNFEYGESKLNSLVEDGNPNKPSLHDLSYLLTQVSNKMTIALPDGVTTLIKGDSKLVQKISEKLNFLGTIFPQHQDLFFTAEIYSLLKESGIDRYNSETWLTMLQYLGITTEYTENKSIENQEQRREVIKPTGKIISRQYTLLESTDYSERIKELISMA